MAAPVISRLVLTDDDGTGLTGTPLNNQLFQDLQNRIDTLSSQIVAMIPAVPAGVVTTTSLANNLHTLATARILTLANYPGAIQVDLCQFDCLVINDQGSGINLYPPVWSGANGITPRDEASLIYRIRDNGITQPIVWTNGGSWVQPMQGIPMPAATVPAKSLHIGFRWSARVSTWFCVALATD